MILLFLWWITGMVGAYVAWLDEFRGPYNTNNCPSPRALVIMLVFGWVGPILLGVALSFWFFDWLRETLPAKSWWSTPICDLWRKK